METREVDNREIEEIEHLRTCIEAALGDAIRGAAGRKEAVRIVTALMSVSLNVMIEYYSYEDACAVLQQSIDIAYQKPESGH